MKKNSVPSGQQSDNPPSSAALLLDAPDELLVRNLLSPSAVQVGISLQDFLIGDFHVRRQGCEQRSHQACALIFTQGQRLLFNFGETHGRKVAERNDPRYSGFRALRARPRPSPSVRKKFRQTAS